ncbi:hypothetical protein BGZ49_010117 [Haplosporangium sp. Z 27]|nr:hypothetical protein BGZ49_010117 [Haplosporangium sp. Z 27]
MHRARSLTINTSNACLVHKFNTFNSSDPTKEGGFGDPRPYTPPPPSCRLHKIYEEKLDILGSLGHENWFDDNANPFYRHTEPELTLQDPDCFTNAVCDTPANDDRVDDGLCKNLAKDSINTVIKTTTPPSNAGNQTPCLVDNESDSELEELIDCFWKGEEADEVHDLFFSYGYRDTRNDKNQENDEKYLFPKTEMDHRRQSNRNRIMDRGRLMPDTTDFMTLPWQKESKFIMGGAKIRALSPYPRRTFEF